MMTPTQRATQLAQAVQNNVQWCDLVCRTHGAPGEYAAHLWLNRQQTPRFYPNAITLTATGPGTPAQQGIYDLLASTLPAHGAVKDSFCRLDLEPLGFTQLFVAQWLWCDPTLAKPANPIADVRWVVIQDAQALAQWETAWNGQPASAEATVLPRVFLPVLLANPAVTFLAAYVGEEIIGGAITNHSGDVVGVSNLFYPEQEAEKFWAGCIATIRARYPTLPLVGYEQGADLAVARMLGFVTVGPLQVWAR